MKKNRRIQSFALLILAAVLLDVASSRYFGKKLKKVA